MSVIDVIEQLDKLEAVDQKRVMTHLVLKRLKENHQYRKELARRLDDKNPENWISLEELESRLKK